MNLRASERKYKHDTLVFSCKCLIQYTTKLNNQTRRWWILDNCPDVEFMIFIGMYNDVRTGAYKRLYKLQTIGRPWSHGNGHVLLTPGCLTDVTLNPVDDRIQSSK